LEEGQNGSRQGQTGRLALAVKKSVPRLCSTPPTKVSDLSGANKK